ncbi:DNA-binding response regulator [Dokdonia pacifica]|uniref:Two component transcriptional regulator, LytTR family n=1 Tax=Dokdonia pacifica TaxID=1627892 RepID=A0A239AXR5_9FLAO|nr:LytTR family DNA-binding domain-containing protein [Dokdonia pacifica]GGG32370.1 DNA-binding response regulator [Dokdonia pacifica]SNS00495.1 two component transcriptional regulator, LytTR family [Dokdonia pacifica]
MIKYIIVDDETASHDIIKEYAASVSYLSFQTSCYNAFEAIEYLTKNNIDLIFLDINMPKLSGFDFLKTLSNPPKIIVTTAYNEYALEGYELNIEDYLLKPFHFLRFMKAVNKVYEASTPSSKRIQDTITPDSATIFIKEEKKYHQISLSNILFIEAYGNYTKIHMTDKLIVSHQTLSSFTQNLPENQFIRVHKSYIVSIPKIELIEGNRILIKTHKIPIGKMYKLNVDKLLS